MKRVFLFVLLCVLSVSVWANDGVYFAAGNQLIPVTETDIRVQKEVLSINREGDHLKVIVYYEFYNPVGEKDLLVGFEAPAAYPPEERYMKAFPEQPHIRNFKVVLNDQPLSYEIAHVPGSLYDTMGRPNMDADYYQNGRIQGWSKQQCEDSLAEFEYMITRFYYVYHFKAHFKKGLNIVKHTYEYDLSYSVAEEFRFDYILSAANRWANKGIDNFTLNINLGDLQSFAVRPTFFSSANEWSVRGVVRSNTTELIGEPSVMFHVQKGGITFQKKHFHPEGELSITQPNMNALMWEASTRSGKMRVPVVMQAMQKQYFHLKPELLSDNNGKPIRVSKLRKSILQNIPYAYRGCVFEDKKMQRFFEASDWYVPNAASTKDSKLLRADEKQWVEYFK